MFAYDFEALNRFLIAMLSTNLTAEAQKWLSDVAIPVRQGDVAKFNTAFVTMPRKIGRTPIQFSASEDEELQRLRDGWSLRGWTSDRLARVWLLMQLDPKNKDRYREIIENLFLNAEMRELVALYSSLPVLAYPETWVKRAAEGIRSNIGQVLESVICNNPFPAEHLDETAWNQLVLKAIFTDQPILQITGLRERRNPALAQSLCDYAHERWAAHRNVNPLLWYCVAPFIDSNNFSDIQRVFRSDDPREREAAALACHESTFGPAKKLLEQNPELKRRVERGEVTW